MNYSTQSSNETEFRNQSSGNSTSTSDAIDWRNIMIGVVMYTVAFVTFIGNLMVLLAVYMNKSLRTAFNFLIVNVAVADMAVAVTAMSFYTTDKMLGYWPFGSIMCTVWIFCDYGLTFASVFTLVAISADRFWSVFWSMNYRSINKKKKSLTMIVTIWVVMLFLWVPALTLDRLKAYHTAGTCKWDPAENRQFVVVIAMLGHHGPCITMLIFYFSVFGYLKTKNKINPLNKQIIQATSSTDKPTSQIDQNYLRTVTLPRLAPGISGQSSDLIIAQDDEITTKDSTGHLELFNAEAAAKLKNITIPVSHSHQTHAETYKQSIATISSRAQREKKVFITLTYIIAAYLICWVPFHFVFDISSLEPEAVPGIVYEVTFWMTYVNSTINPFLYSFGNNEFRQAFKHIISRKPNHANSRNQRNTKTSA